MRLSQIAPDSYVNCDRIERVFVSEDPYAKVPSYNLQIQAGGQMHYVHCYHPVRRDGKYYPSAKQAGEDAKAAAVQHMMRIVEGCQKVKP